MITVKTAEAAKKCLVPDIENGSTDPVGEVEVGETVQYKCKKGNKLKGKTFEF